MALADLVAVFVAVLGIPVVVVAPTDLVAAFVAVLGIVVVVALAGLVAALVLLYYTT